jgi:hypothetical protein
MSDQPQPDPLTPEAMRVQLLALIAQLDAEAVVRLHAFVAWWTTRPGPKA